MAIIVNGTTVPINGDFIVANGTNITKVVANGVTVWEQQKETVIASNVSTQFDRWGNALDMTYDLTGYSRFKFVMTISYIDEPYRGPYDYLRIFVGSSVTEINIMEGGGKNNYDIDQTIDISYITGTQRIRFEAGFYGDEDINPTIKTTVKQVILYP